MTIRTRHRAEARIPRPRPSIGAVLVVLRRPTAELRSRPWLGH